jgi:hypothetical protein
MGDPMPDPRSGIDPMVLIVRLFSLWFALALVAVVPPQATVAATSGPILYVDGKIGSDPPMGTAWTTDWGASPARPFKTVKRALDETARGNPTAIRIKGYDDYVYHEAITKGYRIGTQSTPTVISSYTTAEIPSGSIVRPIIDGGIDVGATGWTRPWATTYSHVWCKTWSAPGTNLNSGQKVPPGYDTTVNSAHEDRLYMDGSQPLHRPASVPTIAQLNAQPYSQYWDRTKTSNNLCVHLGLWSGAAIDENPAKHSIVVPWYFGIILAGGSSYVTIRDLRIRHTIMGVGISVSADKAVGKSHHNSVYNVDASYNYRMGFWTAGDDNVFDKVSGSRNTIQLVKLDAGAYSDGSQYGAQRNTIRNSTSTQNLGHGFKLSGRLVQHNYLYDNVLDGAGVPTIAKSAGGATQGIQIANGASYNAAWRNTIRSVDAGIELYQYDSNGGPLTGNSLHHNRLEYVGTGVFLWDNKVSTTYGTGASTFSYNTYYNVQTAIGGNGTTSGKVFDHETMRSVGFRKNANTASVDSSGVNLMAGTVSITNSIIDLTNGPAICPRTGAVVNLSYTDIFRWRDDPRTSMPKGAFCKSTAQHGFGTVRVGTGVLYVDPGYIIDAASSGFLAIGPSSPVVNKASDGSRLGAR